MVSLKVGLCFVLTAQMAHQSSFNDLLVSLDVFYAANEIANEANCVLSAERLFIQIGTIRW